MITVNNTGEKPANQRYFDFYLPDKLQCGKPTEVRGIDRDEVRMMVSYRSDDHIEHSQFRDIEGYLQAGDVIVVNTSGTLKAALEGTIDQIPVRVHFSTRKNESLWILELREMVGNKTRRFVYPHDSGKILLKDGGEIYLREPYYQDHNQNQLQLWKAGFKLDMLLEEYLHLYGKPIRYNYVDEVYPGEYYQTVFARYPGSAEMPSAGRAFTHELVTRLVSKGVHIVPILLHTGVASVEIDEKPYEEYYHVPFTTANMINHARKQGRKIIATGTTVVRALETVSDHNRVIKTGKGWTDIFITPERGLFSVDGLITGFHEPKASHLLMLEALAGRNHLRKTYTAAVEEAYLWHEFGDLHLILP